ncbi:M56 family metallopeptidase [Aegicerativicinus sediminis]|uniref:M56 family metallopeptidase n=1 Tax=Aegicerativicinus sediminis TaxID=2893202 RepID=UPI001E636C6B|nr:M56 family metallopeptidase [Aegicerativicinus sediminis]
MNLVIYILKFSGCLVIFLFAYKFLLESTNQNTLKRFYLISILLLSATIPFISLTTYSYKDDSFVEVGKGIILNESESLSDLGSIVSIWNILTIIYLIGFFAFALRFIFNLSSILDKIRLNPKRKKHHLTYVLLNDNIAPHTFFSFIFFNKKKFETDELPMEILVHEHIHAEQLHSIDILFIELIKIIMWFNPVVYHLEKYIKLNHEFLADQGVISHGTDPIKYSNLLVNTTFQKENSQLVNSFNYSSIKKRIQIMKTRTSKKSLRLRFALALPLFAIAFYGFSTKKVIPLEYPTQSTISTQSQQEKATKEQIAEYNKIAKHYNNMPEDDIRIDKRQLERMKYLYSIMSVSQRENAEPLPVIKLPPPPPPAPSPDGLKEVIVQGYPAPKPKGEINEVIVQGYPSPKSPNRDQLEAPVPPPPPPAISPMDFVIKMAKKDGSKFFYNGKPISSDGAIKLLKNNKNLNIVSQDSKTENPKIFITNKPIVHEN